MVMVGYLILVFTFAALLASFAHLLKAEALAIACVIFIVSASIVCIFLYRIKEVLVNE